jgi:threonine dehydrogenase-like Zn-dependent dehydrogenase
MENTIPQTESAIQLIGEDKLVLNSSKSVTAPGPHQILMKVEAVGLCFSDLKLLKQFHNHARKSEIISGADNDILAEIPSYKPCSEPTVPGHEAFGVIVAVGDKVQRHCAGEKVLVQTDYRWLKTAASNSAFGYNFEGGLQEYVLMDERIIVDPESGESFLIPVDKDISASAIALVEPWACVESSYITEERSCIKPAGRLLVVADAGFEIKGLAESFSAEAAPAQVTACCAEVSQLDSLKAAGLDVAVAEDIASLPPESFDDIVYFGCDKQTIETLDAKLAALGIINIVLAGGQIGADVSVSVGRTHYGMTRWIGTTSPDASASYKNVPAIGEVRTGDNVLIVGAAGPMGQMHTIRLLCAGIENISVVGTDFDDERLESLAHKAKPLAEQNNVNLALVNPQNQPVTDKFSYFAIMAPVAPLVAKSIKDSAGGALINIFAGIPATVKQDIDLDTYIANRCYMFGTSGSRLSDMKIVLEKVLSGSLDTNCSVDAVSGMAGAIDGIRALENRLIPGKIVVYPELKSMPLIRLEKLAERYPEVYAKLNNGIWSLEAEKELLGKA